MDKVDNVIQTDDPVKATLVAPAVVFALRLGTATISFFIYLSIRDNIDRGYLDETWVYILGFYALGMFWGFRSGLHTTLSSTAVRVERKYGPFHSILEIPLREIEELSIPLYSVKLVAKLRDGRSAIIANKNSVSRGPLPDIDFGPGVPYGPIRTLLRFKRVVDDTRADIIDRA